MTLSESREKFLAKIRYDDEDDVRRKALRKWRNSSKGRKSTRLSPSCSTYSPAQQPTTSESAISDKRKRLFSTNTLNSERILWK